MRPRKFDRHLPACVYFRHGAYWYVKRGKWRRLASDLGAALHEYARIVAQPADGVPALIDQAMPSLVADVRESTAAQYRRAARQLAEVFKEFRPEQIKRGDIMRMMDAYAYSASTANRMLTVLRLVLDWACKRDIIPDNPAVKVDRIAQSARDRLIARSEYDAIYGRASPRLQCIMDICRLTGQRIGDVLSIRRSQITEVGIAFEQQKTGHRLTVAWTPELREVVARTKSLTGNLVPQTLFYARGGRPPQYANVWRDFKLAAKRAGIKNVRPHDLRALAATEAQAQGLDPGALLGHKSARTTEVYLRDRTPKVAIPPSYGVKQKASKKG